MLKGLILSGGKSERMGTDKSRIKWHGIEHRCYLANMLRSLSYDSFISCRSDQEATPEYPAIIDRYAEMGPYGALLTAFEFEPATAWLVLACDLPLLDSETIAYLISERDDQKIATAYENPDDGLPEPLLAIWEPRAVEMLEKNRNNKSLRRVLTANDIKMIAPKNKQALFNVNTPEEMEEVMRRSIIHTEQKT